MKAFFVGLIVLGLQMPLMIAAQEPESKPLFEDKFDSTLAKDWTWKNEDSKAWRTGKNGLEIRALPGHGAERKNRLLGPMFKAGTEVSVEVFLEFHPTVQFEHAGVHCYFDENNWVGMMSEADIVMTNRKDGQQTFQTLRRRIDVVWMRMVISQGKATEYYREKATDEWKKFAECDLPSDKDFRFSLIAGGGPKDTEDWARFRDFRVLPLVK